MKVKYPLAMQIIRHVIQLVAFLYFPNYLLQCLMLWEMW